MRGAIALLTLTVLVVVWTPAFAATLTGKVVKVADGDSITVLDNTNTQHRIRLQSIDAPEKGQPFGNASRKHLASLVAGKEVTVQWDKRDRYRRIVGFVLVARCEPCAGQGKDGVVLPVLPEGVKSREQEALYPSRR
jgi:endonuclease YncB( thermonuclease family)